MSAEQTSNEYGHYLFKSFVEGKIKDGKKDRAIIYLHDHFDNPDVFNDFAEELKLFDYYALSLPGDDIFEFPTLYKNNFHFTCQYVKDLVLSLPNRDFFLIAHGTAAPIAMYLSSVIPSRIKKITLINPFTSKTSIEQIRWISTLPRKPQDMELIMKKMFMPDDKEVFCRGWESPEVIKRMKNVYNYWPDLANYVEDIVSVTSLEELRLFEENLRCPLQLILGGDDKWLVPHEAIYTFQRYPDLSVVQIPKSAHYPLRDQKRTTIDAIMKFFVKNVGLNSEKRLPNKYLYRYLDDDWKKYYRYQFAEKLSARDLEEYNNKMKELEKGEASIKFVNEEYKDYINEVVANQTRALDDIYIQVDQNYKQTKKLEADYKQQLNDWVQIDWTYPANKVYTNGQGLEVFHDGKGFGFWKDQNGEWKKVRKPKNI